MKKREISALGELELNEHLSEVQKELMKLSVQLASGGSIKSPGTIRKLKKTIARINTRITSVKRTKDNAESKLKIKKQNKKMIKEKRSKKQ